MPFIPSNKLCRKTKSLCPHAWISILPIVLIKIAVGHIFLTNSISKIQLGGIKLMGKPMMSIVVILLLMNFSTSVNSTYGSNTILVMYSFGILDSWWENTFFIPTSQIKCCSGGFSFKLLLNNWNFSTPLRSSSFGSWSRDIAHWKIQSEIRRHFNEVITLE